MTRRSIRENIFLIVFKAEFNNQEEMEEQIRYSISKIEEPEEDPEDVAITETGKVKEGGSCLHCRQVPQDSFHASGTR